MSITLTAIELQRITGYRRAGAQLAELHRLGFTRARRSKVKGTVILERVHYDAVCTGHTQTQAPRVHAPQPRLKAA